MTADSSGAPRFDRSSTHTALAKRVIPGGAHALAKGDDQYPADMAPVLVCGSGCRVEDLDGNRFVEYGMGLRTVTLGHGEARVDDAVAAAIRKGVNFARPHALELAAAEALLELFPWADMAKFGVNGSDVTAAAVRLARAYTERERIAVCREHPMFGTADWFIGTTAMPAGVPDGTRQLTSWFHYNDLDSARALVRDHPGEIAAFVLEVETTTPPDPEFLAGLRRLCDGSGALLIVDEIITGFRWHLHGAQHVHGVRPDLCTLGKGLANGYPLAALVGRGDIMRLGGFVKDRDRVYLLSQTYGAQPWALAAMLAVIDVYKADGVIEQLYVNGQALRAGVDRAVRDHGLQGHVQLAGRDCNLVFVTRDEHGERSQGFRTLFLQELLERRILAPSFVVSAAHDASAIDATIGAVDALLPVYRRGLEDGLSTVLRGRPVKPSIRSRG
jgi:glutamate-1-semialdehyde 2,1-aminomutase